MKLAVDGRTVYAYTGGKAFDPALPCSVFLHGALQDHSVWTLLARWFAHHGHAVLAPDLPGHAHSDGPPLPDVETLAGWTLDMLDAAGIATADLVGHSLGSLIALEAAARAPQRARRLVMSGTAYPMTVSDALLASARDEPLAAIDMVNAWSHAGLAAKPSYPGPGMWLHGANRALMRRVQAAQTGLNLFSHDFGICNRYAGGLEAAAKVVCPATLILGDRDQMTGPKQTGSIAAALTARVRTVAAGHSMLAEAPDAVLAALREALA